MTSVSASRSAILALHLFLSFNENDSFLRTGRGSTFVESFHPLPLVTRTGKIDTHFAWSHTHRGYRHVSNIQQSRFRLRVVNSETTPRLGFNDTERIAPLEATPLADPTSLAEAERAWALDSPAEVVLETEKKKRITLLSAEILGPVISIAVVVAFLLFTLLTTVGISDAFTTMDFEHKFNVLSRISWLPGSTQDAKVTVALVMAFSAFAQALTGFGFAVVAVGAMSSMPWLLHSELYEVITPVAATLGALVGFILLTPAAFADGPATDEAPGLDWSEILPLLIPCTVLTPLGIKLNGMVDPVLATRVLAGLIMAFVCYKLVPTIQGMLGDGENDDVGDEVGSVLEDDADPSFLQSRAGAILMGSAAGIFGGAFDVQGPPLCVYGDAKEWSPAKFRNNVLAVVALNSAFVVAIAYFNECLGNFYYSYFCLTSMPGVLLGVVVGQYVSTKIDPVLFKNLVLIMCLGLGIQLLRVS